jgi:hypothetical protein
MGLSHGVNIVKDGLVFSIDAANQRSYPRSGTDWFNLENLTISGSLINGPNFDNNNQGSIDLEGIDDYIELQEANSLSGTWFDIINEVNHFRIGALTMSNSVFGSQKTNANIYNFKIYNRALSAQEIKQNYNALKGRFGL